MDGRREGREVGRKEEEGRRDEEEKRRGKNRRREEMKWRDEEWMEGGKKDGKKWR